MTTPADDLRRQFANARIATILADPPWRFQNRTGKMAPEHRRLSRYATMDLPEIAALPVAETAAPTAHLYLWVPNALLQEGLSVMQAWGFQYKSNLVWLKIRKDGGPDGRGVGFYFRNVTELEVYDQGYKNLFGTFTSNDTISEPLATLIKAAAPTIRRVAILARNDLYPLALGQEFEKSCKSRGMEVVYFQKYAINTMDHASALTEIRAARPDWFIATGYINDTILMRKQMADLGVRAQAVTMANGPAYQEYIDALGPLAENVTTAVWWHPAARYISKDVFGSTEAYNKAFMDAYKVEPDWTCATGSAAGILLQMAIERAGTTDRDAVRTELAKGGYDTFFGPLSFNAAGQVISYVPPVVQVQNGKMVVVYPDVVKQGTLRFGVK